MSAWAYLHQCVDVVLPRADQVGDCLVASGGGVYAKGPDPWRLSVDGLPKKELTYDDPAMALGSLTLMFSSRLGVCSLAMTSLTTHVLVK